MPVKLHGASTSIYVAKRNSVTLKFDKRSFGCVLIGLMCAPRPRRVIESTHLSTFHFSLQLWAADQEHSKEMVEQSSDAGANLRTHRYRGDSSSM